MDSVSTDEAALSVYQEVSLLFQDIKAAARGAADMVRSAGSDLHGVGNA
ncbi:hypothetical protein [Microvirga sp. TS319]